MKMTQCPNGHFYDNSKYDACPYCTTPAPQQARQQSHTVGLTPEAVKTEPIQNAKLEAARQAQTPGAAVSAGTANQEPVRGTEPQQEEKRRAKPADESHTVAIIERTIGVDPVVGWLVCIEGNDKGRDYRIHADNNFIGRDERMDITILSDETVSRRNHAVISFDARTGVFYFSPDEGRSITRHNGKPLFTTVELAPKDEIEIGMTKLLFIPLCGEDFAWK